MAIYRRWGRNERRRLDGPPRGGAADGEDADGRPDPNPMSREDIEAIIGFGSKIDIFVLESLDFEKFLFLSDGIR